MADLDLNNYQMQLQQVKAALSTDPDNEELLKLKSDLEEVIELTKDLIRAQNEEQKKSYIAPAGSSGYDGSYYERQKASETPTKYWKVGDKCQAKWTDGQYHDATIEAITDDGQVNIIFDNYQNRGETTLKDLRERKVRNEVFQTNSNKRVRPNQKEYLKKKKQKKLERLKGIEESREQEKNKWLSFAAKTSKKNPGTKSIFASPDSVTGRVGIGTCGISGKGMTKYVEGEKYRKGL
ncbi:survival of motor neuron-related-splicing factor 30 [Culicoides brevitarsis]|uniref:survival of motor neuron-related-splicing factor 30 n=1 Tax=Culicoides brevitarsis TaxID=469753 RepID=UPI00307BEF33